MPLIVTRHSKPRSTPGVLMEQFPKGTIYKNLEETAITKQVDVFVQTSNNEDYPQWRFVGVFNKDDDEKIEIESEKKLIELTTAILPQ